MDEEEHEVYGGEIPDMEGDIDGHNADVDMSAADEDAVKELDEMKKRLKEMEEEAAALREMQAKVEKEMGAVSDPASAAANQANREETDSRSVFVGNVRNMILLSSYALPFLEIIDAQFVLFSALSELFDVFSALVGSWFDTIYYYDRGVVLIRQVDYACTPEEVQQHFQSCGTVNRVTILTDKFGQPKGFAYVEFLEVEAIQEALQLNESELHGRQLKVLPKRTNVPGMKQYRGRRFNPYTGFRGRRPYVPPYFYSPYGYGKVPRFRRPMRYMPYY
ncbi:hypothetical protein Pint_27607 [Pistacia integerrima]|uniref:Uncharacterized protein n=1 Tax=Pistacia integerrima TaxID=434235 RepID=A0ACC0YRD5_9ROSI|nr:hypothetical protein Pint_27607 [Pistacia integerrima]